MRVLTRKFSSVVKAVEQRADSLGLIIPMHETIVHTAMLLCTVKDKPCTSIKGMTDELTNLLYLVDYDLAVIDKSKFKLEGDSLSIY